MTSTGVTDEAEDSGPGGYAAARLRLLTEGARSGPPRRRALAELTDGWLAGLFGAATEEHTGISLVAVGGYGRGELSPRSDLDLLLLHDGRDDKAVAALADRLWYPVWDLGIDLDHSVRTPQQARKTAAQDLKVHLGLLDARHLAGDLGLTASLRTAVLADWRNQAPKRLPELRDLCAERAERQGELQFLLEPDLKEARGGLRDATVLRAVAASWLADAPREDSPRPGGACSTYATPSTWRRAGRPTGWRCRNRTRWRPNWVCWTPTRCCDRCTRRPASSPTRATSPGARWAACSARGPYGRGCAP